eukprot:1148997-Pelagomonas_calceolata.AAC.3
MMIKWSLAPKQGLLRLSKRYQGSKLQRDRYKYRSTVVTCKELLFIRSEKWMCDSYGSASYDIYIRGGGMGRSLIVCKMGGSLQIHGS